MIEQIYQFLALFVFSPIFFVYLYFFYEWKDRRLNLILIAVGSVLWAMVWPIVLGIVAYKKLKNR